MHQQMTRQKDLFEEAVREALVPEEMQPELVTQLALLMFALVDIIETEMREEQDRR
ncbi:hypothetical protein [Paraburkholderia sediminicola]|uniref:hypothetical protein n=1 Tax=Paraburkholderia sediminicola TaxID=458836 RepID=UPI0038BB1F9D